MKKLVSGAVFMLLLACGVKAQPTNHLSLQLAVSQFEVGYQHQLFSEKTWAEAYVGLGNQDINNRFDDFLGGLRIGYHALSTLKNQLSFHTDLGIYSPNNDYYKATTPVIGAGLRYLRFIGQSGQHSVFVTTEYQYGTRDYKEHHSSETVEVSSIGTFEVAPVCFSVGYGYNF